jgi:hypothetical protein
MSQSPNGTLAAAASRDESPTARRAANVVSLPALVARTAAGNGDGEPVALHAHARGNGAAGGGGGGDAAESASSYSEGGSLGDEFETRGSRKSRSRVSLEVPLMTEMSRVPNAAPAGGGDVVPLDYGTRVPVPALPRNMYSSRTMLVTSGSRLTPEYERNIVSDNVAKNYRTRLRFALAVLAVLNFAAIVMCFFLAAPPGMGSDVPTSTTTSSSPATTTPAPVAPPSPPRNESDNESSSVPASTTTTSSPTTTTTTTTTRPPPPPPPAPTSAAGIFDLPGDLPQSQHVYVFIAEALIQLACAIAASVILFVSLLSRNPDMLPSITFVLRSPGHRNAGVTASDIAEFAVWIIHCPVMLANHHPRARYADGLVLFRLYAVVLAGMTTTSFNSPMVRVMANFFGLRLTAGVFLRWALEFHKWKTLIPTFMFLWWFMALCFTFAERTSFGSALWFIIVTMSTVGYGDITPITFSGRFVAGCAICVGLVILAYIVAQVQQLTQRTEREQKVLDALNVSVMRTKAKALAAQVFTLRYRLRKAERDTSMSGFTLARRAQLHFESSTASRQLRALTESINLLPTAASYEDTTAVAVAEVRDEISRLASRFDAQSRVLADLTGLVRTQQELLNRLVGRQTAAAAAHASEARPAKREEI